MLTIQVIFHHADNRASAAAAPISGTFLELEFLYSTFDVNMAAIGQPLVVGDPSLL
jgi:hypothetical protein